MASPFVPPTVGSRVHNGDQLKQLLLGDQDAPVLDPLADHLKHRLREKDRPARLLLSLLFELKEPLLNECGIGAAPLRISDDSER